MLNAEQIKVLKFYEGDVEPSEDPFWSDPKAYVTWNALLFSTTDTELARTQEERVLNCAFLKDPDRVIDITKTLLSCMKRSTEDLHVKRVERLSDYRCFLKERRFTSFVSTSTAGFLKDYQDKDGLVLMEITIPKDHFCADLSEELDTYQKQDEKEILLAPYSSFSLRDLKMNETLKAIKDRNGDSPKVYCEVTVGKYLKRSCQKIFVNSEMIEASMRFYDALNQHKIPDQKDECMYLDYKHYIQSKVQEWMDQYDK